jgi:UDP-GlcNAc:undecaprenyl-phosphate GlcNAc-1-phosphate transferase
MIFSCLIYEQTPGYIAWLAAGLCGVLLLARFFRPDWLGAIIRTSCYLIIPFVVFLSQEQAHSHFGEKVLLLYDPAFILVAFATLLTLKYTRRQKGFKPSPFDFIILFLAVVVPNLPDPMIQRYALGQFTIKMITIMFALEVMIGEMRGQYRWLMACTMGFLGIIGIRGIL